MAPDDYRCVAYSADHDPSLDALTGLPHRAELERRAAEAIARARAGGGAVSCLLVDVDDLTRVNDAFGQPAGDAVLRAVAERLVAVARPADLVARVGADSLALLLADTDRPAALATADRVRDAIASR